MADRDIGAIYQSESLSPNSLPGIVTGFGDAVCVEGQRVFRQERALADGVVPLLEEAGQRGGGIKALEVLSARRTSPVSAVGPTFAVAGIFRFFSDHSRA